MRWTVLVRRILLVEFSTVSFYPLRRSFHRFASSSFTVPRSLNRLNEYTPVSRRNVVPRIRTLNFNRENMLALFVRDAG